MNRAWSALAFLEKSGGVEPEVRISTNSLIKAAINELAVQKTPCNTKPTKKAPQVPASLILSCERVAVYPAEKKYICTFAWFRMLRFWGSLRCRAVFRVAVF